MGVFAHRQFGVIEQVRIPALTPTAHSASQLVQLGQAVTLSPVDNQGVGVGDIEASFDDGRRDEHIKAPLPEIDHHRFEIVFRHLSVGDGHPGLGNHFSDLAGFCLDGLHAVVHKEHLALTQ